MSVSTRTAQAPLGLGQLGATLVVIALAVVIAAAVAFGSLASKPAPAIPAAVGAAPPAVIDHHEDLNSLVKRDVTQNWGSYVSGGRPSYLTTGGDTSPAAGNDARHGGMRAQ
jgi:hypothetical protein